MGKTIGNAVKIIAFCVVIFVIGVLYGVKFHTNTTPETYRFKCPVCKEQLEYSKTDSDKGKIVCPECGLIMIFSQANESD